MDLFGRSSSEYDIIFDEKCQIEVIPKEAFYYDWFGVNCLKHVSKLRSKLSH